ncbi:kinase-like domain [Cordyceps militaris]|uniref:Kinase-like domain n=1 Tax=Cordyceps militaris TaxID=73501 RepID=A0A2H4SVR6_CORMI|nr:kinase-like domain [Cordyceps militaris]
MGEMLVCRIHPLCGTDAHRITAEELRRDWDIVAFIQPIPPDEIRRWLDELRPWDADCAEPYDFDLPDSYDPYYDPRVSESVSFGIRRVAYNYIGKYYVPCVSTPTLANLGMNSPGVKHLSSSDSNIHHWDVTQMFHQCDPATIRKHRLHSAIPPSSELPHLSCFLHDDEILESDGGLSTAELITIMVCYVPPEPFRPDQSYSSAHVKITVFSCSGRQVRIVQGCIDFRHYQFDVRCSDILDFNEGGMRRTKENEQRFYTFLGWILGNPVGNIKEPQHPGSRR